jgi:hypothetical protein
MKNPYEGHDEAERRKLFEQELAYARAKRRFEEFARQLERDLEANAAENADALIRECGGIPPLK